MVGMGAKMTNRLFVLILVAMSITGCAIKTKRSLPLDIGKVEKTAPATPSEAGKAIKPPSVIVDSEDLEVLEKMNKAVESYVLKSDAKPFTELCKDKRFDCFIDEKKYPKQRKKILRTIPPYASGSKMGLQGEVRVHVRYDFYP